jgi:hypothetical protein
MKNSISKAQKTNYQETPSITKDSPSTQKHSFPTEIFPKNIQNLIRNAEETVGYNPEYLSAGILSTSATAIGSSVRLFNGSYDNPPILWLNIIGRSGDGKTHPLNLAKQPIAEMDKKALLISSLICKNILTPRINMKRNLSIIKLFLVTLLQKNYLKPYNTTKKVF